MFQRCAIVCMWALLAAPAFGEKLSPPDFDSAVFIPGDPIDNPFFPLVAGTVYTYAADLVDPDTGEMESVVIEEWVTFNTEEVAGVQAREVRVREWIDAVLVEDTLDWYAQDIDGNVWYLGEFVMNFIYNEEGELIDVTNDGSWEAGVNGAEPGYIMLADPQPGDEYYQEFAPNDGAVDQAEVTALDAEVSGPTGDYDDVLVILESTALEHRAFENKLYAEGIGLVEIQEGVDKFGDDPENVIPLVSVTQRKGRGKSK